MAEGRTAAVRPRDLSRHVSTPFSLFDGDRVNRSFSAIGLPGRRARHIAGRIGVLFVLTWLPLAVFALVEGFYSIKIEGRNFFADFAAYAQFWIGLPLFVISERIVNRHTREAAKDFLDTGVLRHTDLPKVDAAFKEVARLRTSDRAELVLVGLAYFYAVASFLPEMLGAGFQTWHTTDRWLTGAGWWAMLVTLPILNYTWLRLGWKTLIWTRFLYRMSRLRLTLVAAHPDRTGGIGFISEVQAKFALFIFAYGISNVAAMVAYKIAVEGAPWYTLPILGSTAGFVVGAPLLFTMPLLMFSKQLFRTKRRALAVYREQATRQAVAFEERWFDANSTRASVKEMAELNTLVNVSSVFDRIEQMRIVPFDLKSASQLFGSTLGSVATILPLIRLDGPLAKWLEALATLFGK